MTKHLVLGLALLLLAAGAAVPASAQTLVNPFGREGVTIGQDDLALMHKAIEKVLNDYKAGGKSGWKSTTSDRAGLATLLKTFKQKDMQCGEVEHVFTAGGGRRYVLPYCKTKEGQWKLAF